MPVMGTSPQQCLGKCTGLHCYSPTLRPPASAQTAGYLERKNPSESFHRKHRMMAAQRLNQSIMNFVNWSRTAITSWPMRHPIPYLKATGLVLFTAGICGTSICPGSILLFEYRKGRGQKGIDTLLAGQVRVQETAGI